MKKLGLVLGSGGARGVAHIGFLKALEDAGIKPDYISGCSMGAVVGGCYATGMDADAMMREVSALSATDILPKGYICFFRFVRCRRTIPNGAVRR